LHGPSLVTANNLYTVDQAIVIRVIGSLPLPVMRQVDAALNTALGL
jgi:hypothetical protein